MGTPAATDPDLLFNGLPPGSRIADSTVQRHNSAVTLSLLCALLWPICLLVPILLSQLGHTSQLPNWVGTLTGLGLFVAPAIGIPAGAVGLYRALRRPALRASWWLASIGLVLCLVWFAGLFVL